jgi:mono/diheme cytochrome c family protein
MVRLALLIVVFSLVLIGCKMHYPVEKVSYALGDANLAEGKRMAQMTCGPCHYNSSTKSFTGKRLLETPGIVGKIYASNITQHKEVGIGSYTDAELAYLIRTGISRTGKLMPYMKRPNLADEDLQNIIAYLRSDDPLVKPSPVREGRTKYTPLGKMGISMSKPLDFPKQGIAKPDAQLALGKYLVDNLGCYHCHSKSFASLNELNPEKSKGFMGGGNKMLDASGKKVTTPNLTAHSSGLGNWNVQDFKRALTEGLAKDNSVITFPMPQYPELKQNEISAIFAYLQSVPQLEGN